MDERQFTLDEAIAEVRELAERVGSQHLVLGARLGAPRSVRAVRPVNSTSPVDRRRGDGGDRRTQSEEAMDRPNASEGVQKWIAWWDSLSPEERQREFEKMKARKAYWMRCRMRVLFGLCEEKYE